MAKFAVINQNNYVINVILADSKNDAELLTNYTCIEYTDENSAGIGDSWDGEKFIKPTPIVPTESTETIISE